MSPGSSACSSLAATLTASPRAAVPLQDLASEREIALHHSAKRLRVKSFAECSRSGDVAEEDGHGLPDLARRRHFCQRGSTGAAEAEPLRVLGTTARADVHPA